LERLEDLKMPASAGRALEIGEFNDLNRCRGVTQHDAVFPHAAPCGELRWWEHYAHTICNAIRENVPRSARRDEDRGNCDRRVSGALNDGRHDLGLSACQG
jgi:hypothetical protein